MEKLFFNNKGISQLVGYMLTLGVTAVAITASIFVITNTVDERKEEAAEMSARQIANDLASVILDLRTVRDNLPKTNYSRTVDIPLHLVNPRYPYYVELTDDYIYVNSSNGQISERAGLLNTSEIYSMHLTGKVFSYSGMLSFETNPTVDAYKFDFGSEDSIMPIDVENYIKITDNCSNSHPFAWDKWYGGTDTRTIFNTPRSTADDNIKYWHYRTRINIKNPTNKVLENHQVLIKLDPSNFNYDLANFNGSDIRFIGNTTAGDPESLNYWIEVWNPFNTSTSRIWVNLSYVPADGCDIWMYHGNPNVNSQSNGSNTFIFFDDFTGSSIDTTNRWNEVNNPNGDCDIKNNMLFLKGNASLRSIKAHNLTDGIIEAKAKSVTVSTSSQEREANLFVRYNYSRGDGLPDCVVTFSNGYNLEVIEDLSISCNMAVLWKYDSTDPIFAENNNVNVIASYSTGISPLDDNKWRRLTVIANKTEIVGARYNYESYSLNANPLVLDISGIDTNNDDKDDAPLDGHFGICTTHEGITAFFDWIYVRNYSANLAGTTFEEQFVSSQVGGTQAQYSFGWNDVNGLNCGNNSLSNKLSRDFVTGGQTRRFNIANLSKNADYTIVLVVGGDNTNDITNFKISSLENSVFVEKAYISNLAAGEYSKLFFYTQSNVDGEIVIQFEDTGSANDFWNICWMDVEKGIRSIELSRGEE